ncbi:hypothetical protein ACHAWF_014649 [Thalassiosira exigua]
MCHQPVQRTMSGGLQEGHRPTNRPAVTDRTTHRKNAEARIEARVEASRLPGCHPPPPDVPLAPRVVVLQHPLKLRRKNQSLPLVELCLFGKGSKKLKSEDSTGAQDEDAAMARGTTQGTTRDFAMKTVVGRRFGDQCDSSVMKILRDPNEVVVLVFPHKEALDLEEGIRLAERRCGFSDGSADNCEGRGAVQDEKEIGAIDERAKGAANPKKMTLVFVDATWKHAREMDHKTEAMGEWPKDVIRVQMTPTAREEQSAGANDSESDPAKKISAGTDGVFVERRFRIRTPPSPDHLSTAECLAWIVSRVEHNPIVYQSVMKALDCMVEHWRGFATSSDDQHAGDRPGGSRVRSFTDGDVAEETNDKTEMRIGQRDQQPACFCLLIILCHSPPFWLVTYNKLQLLIR